MENVGSEIALRQVPAWPNFTAGSYLHANLAWHLGTVCRVPGMCIFEAWSLIVLHPLGTKHQASCSLIHPRSFFGCSGEGFFASGHSNAVSALEVREHLRLLAPYDLGGCMFILCRVEGAPETLVSASGHSSTLLTFRRLLT